MEDTFGKWVYKRRRDLKLTQQELGEAAGLDPKVAQTRISEIEHNKKYPDAGLRRGLSEALGVSHVDLLVAAGELRRDEVPAPGEPRPLLEPHDLRNLIVAAALELPPNGSRDLYQTIANMIRAAAPQASAVEPRQSAESAKQQTQ